MLYIFASKVSSGFDNSTLPESYTARQISTVRTIVEGLVYLATFVYAANGVGLTMLGFKKLKNRYFDISLEGVGGVEDGRGRKQGELMRVMTICARAHVAFIFSCFVYMY